MNLMIASHAMGFSAQWLTGWMCESPAAKVLFGVRKAETIAAFVHIGTPLAPPVDRPRPSVVDRLEYWTPKTALDGKS